MGIGALLAATLVLRVVVNVGLLDGDRPSPSDRWVAQVPAATHPFVDTVSPRDLGPGACLDRAPYLLARVVACGQGHIAEIVTVFAVEGEPGRPYPPVNDLVRQALGRCRSDVDAYAGVAAGRPRPAHFVAVPASSDWDRGERRVVCYVTGPGGDPLVGSVRAGPAPAGPA